MHRHASDRSHCSFLAVWHRSSVGLKRSQDCYSLGGCIISSPAAFFIRDPHTAWGAWSWSIIHVWRVESVVLTFWHQSGRCHYMHGKPVHHVGRKGTDFSPYTGPLLQQVILVGNAT